MEKITESSASVHVRQMAVIKRQLRTEMCAELDVKVQHIRREMDSRKDSDDREDAKTQVIELPTQVLATIAVPLFFLYIGAVSLIPYVAAIVTAPQAAYYGWVWLRRYRWWL